MNLWFCGHIYSQTNNKYIPNKLWVHTTNKSSLVKFDDYVNNDSSYTILKNKYEITQYACPFKNSELKNIYKLTFKAGDIDSLIQDLRKIEWVVYVEKCLMFETYTAPNDTSNKTSYLNIIQASKTWDLLGNNTSTIAIIDDAIMTTHPDLNSNIYTNIKEIRGNLIDDDSNGYIDDFQGWDVADQDSDVNPNQGSNMYHGTLVAGAASAVTNNGIGIASVCYNAAKIIPIKASNVPVFLTNAEEALDYAITIKSKIICMSFGTSDTTNIKTISTILNLANQKNMVLIAAAGNDGSESLLYPAAFPFVYAVGSTTNADKVSSFSQYGSYIDIMAPGNNIYSTTIFGSLYDYESGTSMSCPIVASSCALMLSVSPQLSNTQIYQCLSYGADNIENINDSKYKGKIGSGRLNIYNAMQCALNNSVSNNINDNSNIQIFPNPVLGTININTDNDNNRNYIYCLFSFDGKLIYEGTSNAKNIQIDVSTYCNGLYILKIRNEHSESVSKILLQK